MLAKMMASLQLSLTFNLNLARTRARIQQFEKPTKIFILELGQEIVFSKATVYSENVIY